MKSLEEVLQVKKGKRGTHGETLVSVIIPCCNGEKFIGEAIESVIGQTYQNWELIIVDDGSVDSSRDIVRRYTNDRRIKLIEHRCNEGIPKTKNDGLAVAQGEYIAFLDQDDIWMPSKLELQLSRFASESKNVGLVCTGMVFVDGNMKIRSVFRGFSDANQKRLLKSLYGNPINSSSVMMVSRQCLSQVGMFDESLRGWDDYELLMRIATRFQVEYVRIPLVRKRFRQDSAQRSPAVRDETQKVFEHVRDLHPFLREYEDFKEAYTESIRLLEQGKKGLARKRLKRIIEKNPHYFDSQYFGARALYMLSALPGQSALKIRGIVSTLRNLKDLMLLRFFD